MVQYLQTGNGFYGLAQQAKIRRKTCWSKKSIIGVNADHFFTVGNQHITCQDYATSGLGNNCAYAIVCDGCSSSPDVDIGARLLALSAKRTLMIGGTDMNYDLFGKVTIRNIENIGNTLPLDPHSLDSTLMVVWLKEKNFKAHLYGDGCFIHKTASTLRMVYVDFEAGTDNKVRPAYLSYFLDKERLKEYEDGANTGSKHVLDISICLTDEKKNSIEVENYLTPFQDVVVSGVAEEGDIVAVTSDGINTFAKSDGTNISWQDIVGSFVDFKTTPGIFVQRRLGFLKRQWAKELTTHYDDISISAIVV